MISDSALTASSGMDWSTPDSLMETLSHRDYKVDLFAAAWNTKCEHWFGPREDQWLSVHYIQNQFGPRPSRRESNVIKAELQELYIRTGVDALSIDWVMYCLDNFAEFDSGKGMWTLPPVEDGAWCVNWANPPYGNLIGECLKYMSRARYFGITTDCLLPVRSDTKWWHDYVWDSRRKDWRPGVKGDFLPGRQKFGDSQNSAPFPSVLVTFKANLSEHETHLHYGGLPK